MIPAIPTLNSPAPRKRRWRSLCAIMVVLLMFAPAAVARDVAGRITEKSTGEPVSAAMVKLMAGKRIVKFVRSNAQGEYRLPVAADSLLEKGEVEFVCNSFEPLRVSLRELAESPDVQMAPKASELEEVIVRPMAIKANGDTIVFDVDMLSHASDRTIEDFIAHLPGMSVSNGTIYYQGEAIKKFYVEGLDILGGQYSLASQNIRREDVKSVEVYERHQPIKALKNVELSDKAAVNIKLKKRALLRPTGHIQGGAGKESKGAAWLGKGFLTLITPKAQTYVTVGGNNFGKSIAGAGYSMGSTASTPVDNLLSLSPLGSGGAPALRYQRTIDAAASLRTGTKLGENGKVTFGLSYNFWRRSYGGEQITTYFMPGGEPSQTIMQSGSTASHNHRISGSLEVEHNAAKLYLRNWLTFNGTLSRGDASIVAVPGSDVEQALRANYFTLTDYSQITIRSDNRVWNTTLNVSFANRPLNLLTARDMDADVPIMQQSAKGLVFEAYASTSLGWQLARGSWLGLALRLNENYTQLSTIGQTGPDFITAGVNVPRGNRLTITAGPEWQFDRRVVRLTLRAPLQLIQDNYRRLAINDGKYDHTQLQVAPNASARFEIIPDLSTSLTASYGRSMGGISSFITEPIYTTYRTSTSLGSGHPATNTSWTFSNSWWYKEGERGLSLTGGVNYMISISGLMRSSFITGETDDISFIARRNRSNTISGYADFSKLVLHQRSTVKLSARASETRSRMMRNEDVVPMATRSFSASASFDASVLRDYVVLNPHLDLGITSQTALGQRTTFVNWKATMEMSAHPMHKLEFKLMPEFASNALASGRRQNNFFLNASARLKLKRWEFEVLFNNLTDRRVASISTISNLVESSSTVWLRGFETMATVRFDF